MKMICLDCSNFILSSEFLWFDLLNSNNCQLISTNITALLSVLQPIGTGFDGFEGRPKLIAWRDRVKKELGEKLFEEAHEALMKSSNMPQKLKNSSSFAQLKPILQKLFR